MHSDRLRAPTPVGSSVWTSASARSASARAMPSSAAMAREIGGEVAGLVEQADEVPGDRGEPRIATWRRRSASRDVRRGWAARRRARRCRGRPRRRRCAARRPSLHRCGRCRRWRRCGQRRGRRRWYRCRRCRGRGRAPRHRCRAAGRRPRGPRRSAGRPASFRAWCGASRPAARAARPAARRRPRPVRAADWPRAPRR